MERKLSCLSLKVGLLVKTPLPEECFEELSYANFSLGRKVDHPLIYSSTIHCLSKRKINASWPCQMDSFDQLD